VTPYSPPVHHEVGKLTRMRLVVRGIELTGFHGYYKQERVKGNRFRVDIAVEGRLHHAVISDQLKDTIDYDRLVALVREINRTQTFFLIESFAGAIADGLLDRFPRVMRTSVRVEKLTPPGLGRGTCTAVELEKERA